MTNNKLKSVLSVIAIIMVCVLMAGLCLSICYKTGLFDTPEQTETTNNIDETANGSVVLSDDTSSGISLLSAVISEDDYDSYGIAAVSCESAYTLTASYNSNATNPFFIWSITGGDDVDNVTITPSEDTISCVVTCSGAFSTQVVITCTAEENPEVYSSCKVDYIKQLTYIKLTLSEGENSLVLNNGYEEFDSVCKWNYWLFDSEAELSTELFYSCYDGTVEETYTIDCIDWYLYDDYINNEVDHYISFYSYTAVDNEIIGYYYHQNYMFYVLNSYFSLALSEDNLTSEQYLYLSEQYEYENPMFLAVVTISGDITGTTYTFEIPLLFNPEALYSVVSEVDVSEENIYFY